MFIWPDQALPLLHYSDLRALEISKYRAHELKRPRSDLKNGLKDAVEALLRDKPFRPAGRLRIP